MEFYCSFIYKCFVWYIVLKYDRDMNRLFLEAYCLLILILKLANIDWRMIFGIFSIDNLANIQIIAVSQRGSTFLWVDRVKMKFAITYLHIYIANSWYYKVYK